MTDELCAKCGHPRAEHSINGACYGLCGEFVAPLPAPDATDWKARCEAAETENKELEAAVGALNQKVIALSPHGICACSYDCPDDLCAHHSPKLTAAQAENEKLIALLKQHGVAP